MGDQRRSWIDAFRQVGLSFADLARAELAALAEDLGRSGGALVRALLVAAIAGAFAFWTLGLLVYLAIELLTLVLPRWGAASVVAGVFLIATAALAFVVRRRLAAIEPPAATVQRRLEDSRRWWRSRVAPPDAEPDAEAGADEPEEGGPR
jgi:hypothetical protein